MNVVIPHKDTLFILSKVARSYISAYNSNAEEYIFPRYPLWAFTEQEIPLRSGLEIQNPRFREGALGVEFFFPLQITNTEPLAIVFATLQKGKLFAEAVDKAANVCANQFPLFSSAFKSGTVTFNGFSWQVFDEKWSTG